MTLPGANITELMKPVKLQELQIHLGCTFRMPLEKIRITNITMLNTNGKFQIIEFDKTIVNLNSNGTVVCLPVPAAVIASSNSSNVRSRQLQSTSGASNGNAINVEYAILDPSDDILSLDDSEFQTVLASSPLTNFQASVGSTGTTAPATTSETSSSSTLLSDEARTRIGLGVGLGITGFVALAAIGAHIQNRRKHRRNIASSSAQPVYSIATQNPVNQFAPANGISDRRMFVPTGSRV
jgi:hypothetical protein